MDKLTLSGFKEWLEKMEAMTSTACVANYSRPSLPMQRREFPRNKKKKEEQKDEK